jgi:NitT/TauT family transport system substrate-binding protein
VGHTAQPYANSAIESGAKAVFTSAETPGLILDAVLTTRKTLERHPEAIQGFVRAWFRATTRWGEDRDAGTRIAAEVLQLDFDTTTLDGVTLYNLADNHRVMAGGANAPLASLIRRYADFFVERGSISRPPNATELFDPSLLPPDSGAMPPP